jgi:hypothetical protein
MTSVFKSKIVSCTAAVNPTLLTQSLFDAAHVESIESPVDQFLNRLHEINRLCPSPTSFDPLQGQLVLLGVVAAVESYFRTLLRRLIVIDEICQSCTEEESVTFGAAIHLSKKMMPEAMLERVTFVSQKSLTEAFRDFAGVKGALPPQVSAAISDFARVCHLRHCAVHRFGKLGVKNAIFLGLSDHSSLLEKPLVLNYVALQGAIAISTGVVKASNNFLFNEVLSRLPRASWSGVYKNDKKIFVPYYELFADTVSLTPAGSVRALYNIFQDQLAKFSAGIIF